MTPAIASDRELRIHCGALRLEARQAAAEAGGDALPIISGHAAVFDQWATLYSGTYWTWREIVRPGAFKNALAERQDVRALVNHDVNQVLGRTASGTCRLREDAVGLFCEIDPPDTQTARDLLELISRGDISGMSIGFRVRPGGDRVTTTETDAMVLEEREILDVDLFDVSPVTYPAYPQTDVAVRSPAAVRDVPHPHSHLRDRDPWLVRAAVRLRLAAAECAPARSRPVRLSHSRKHP